MMTPRPRSPLLALGPLRTTPPSQLALGPMRTPRPQSPQLALGATRTPKPSQLSLGPRRTPQPSHLSTTSTLGQAGDF